MGKIRVYELAKELGFSNKELVERLQELGYAIKSHSSTLDDSMIQEIKDRLQGRKQRSVSGWKAGATVIRRRKKIIEVPTEQEVTAPAPEIADQEKAEAGAEAPAEPEATAVEIAAEEARAEDTATLKAVEEIPEAEEPEVEAAEEPAEALEIEPEAGKAEEEAETAEEMEAVATQEEAAEEEAEIPAEGKEDKKAKKKKKAKPKIKRIGKPKEEPAKIIDRPKIVLKEEVPEEKPKPQAKVAPVTPVEPEEVQPGLDVPIPPVDEESKKLRKKKKSRTKDEIAELETEEAATRRKSLRRRAVIEHDDLYDDEEETVRHGRPARHRKAVRVTQKAKKTVITKPKAIKRRIKVPEAITVGDLARKMGVKAPELIRKLIGLDMTVSINEPIDFDTASVVASDFDYEVIKGSFDEEEILHLVEEKQEGELTPRSPVVTVMGHVDHGKTSLLDAIRKTNVIEGEAGGITQHIGAYHVKSDGREITFLDTPGHEAFTAMRARGAQITDIVVLIVAADDGVMPQTREAVDHAQAAGVPIIVAINKIDKEGADPDRVKRELADFKLVPEEWGGDTLFIEVSAKTGQGIDDLLDTILLQTEMLELKAVLKGRGQGRVVEARLDKGRGPVATLLVQSGQLKTGDSFVCGIYYGRIRAMFDDSGHRVNEAGPSMPVEIQGITGVPEAGDEFLVVEDEKQAKQVSQHRQLKKRETEILKTSKVSLESIYEKIKEGEVKELNLVLKTDVQGSLEAIRESLSKLSTSEIKVNLVLSSTGTVTETDVMLASASDATIIGFNVRPNNKVQTLADEEAVEIRYYDVIYKLIEEIEQAMVGLLKPIYIEHTLGQAEVKEAFHISKLGTIAGSAVTNGKIVRGAKARLVRDGVVIYDGQLSSLKRFKDDAREVLSGYECGIGLENFNDIKAGDLVEAYEIEEKAATLNGN